LQIIDNILSKLEQDQKIAKLRADLEAKNSELQRNSSTLQTAVDTEASTEADMRAWTQSAPPPEPPPFMEFDDED
jgi:hypothetical protein